MKLLTSILLTLTSISAGCSLRTEHHIKVDHNIKITLDKPVTLMVIHKHYYDKNETRQEGRTDDRICSDDQNRADPSR